LSRHSLGDGGREFEEERVANKKKLLHSTVLILVIWYLVSGDQYQFDSTALTEINFD
jgi:hypothetical protein